jgi:oligoendopeptidase F
MASSKKSTQSAPAWDLTDFYKSVKDPKIFSDLKSAFSAAQKFRKTYEGKLPRKSSNLLKAIKQMESIEEKAALPIIYASLLFAESATASGIGQFLQDIRSKYSEVRKELLFFELELSSLSVKELQKLIRDPLLINYKHYIGVVLENKPYRLPTDAERILTDKDISGRNAWVRLFDEEFAHKSFDWFEYDPKRKTKINQRLSESAILAKLHSPDRTIRKDAAASLTKGLKEESRRITFIFNTLLLDKKNEDQIRGYQRAESSRHLSNEISHQTVEAMCSAVESKYSIVQKYYGLKKQRLKVSKLYDYDRYAPIAKNTSTISLSEAKDLVLESFYDFSDLIGEIAEEFFVKNWIDFTDRPGKRGGAFCSFVTPNKHPVVFMNYHGSMRDVFTLAHELGHAVHAYLMRGQSLVNFDTPLTIAETASVFAEMLLFEKLTQNGLSNSDKFNLYASKLENIFATVFRQISMYRFEQDIHYGYRKNGELSTEQINQMWRTRQKKMFANSVELTPDYDYWWSYISHFIHTPFYVYSYAFGELLTLSLYDIYKKEPATFIPKYIQMLSSGSKTPDELMKPFGVDLNSKAFWMKGVKIIEGMVGQLSKMR